MKRHNPRKYDGSRVTNTQLGEVLSGVLSKVQSSFKDRPDLVLLSWPEIIGPNFAPMTEAVSLIDGVLTVKVKNSSLYALLNKSEKGKLIALIQKKFPHILIKTILFRIG